MASQSIVVWLIRSLLAGRDHPLWRGANSLPHPLRSLHPWLVQVSRGAKALPRSSV